MFLIGRVKGPSLCSKVSTVVQTKLPFDMLEIVPEWALPVHVWVIFSSGSQMGCVFGHHPACQFAPALFEACDLFFAPL